jgi:two-component system NtrC family response regulator
MGAFTGAVRDKSGKFQMADGGTLFLDEVGELPVELRPKLLRASQERIVEPVGGDNPRKIDVRVAAATNSDLGMAITAGSFREDLYYRLAIIPIHFPPLGERKEDIALLVRHFLAKHGGQLIRFATNTIEAVQRYPWPANIRELENTIERLLIMRSSDLIGEADQPDKIRGRKAVTDAMINLPAEGYPSGTTGERNSHTGAGEKRLEPDRGGTVPADPATYSHLPDGKNHITLEERKR